MRQAGDEHGQVTLCDWRDVRARLALLDRDGRRFCGMSLGGRIAAGLLKRAQNVPEPDEATHLLLDVSGTGATIEALRQRFPEQDVVCLFDRTTTDRNRGWLVMPWDEDEHQVTPLRPSGLTEQEWQVVERLAECLSLATELDDIDGSRFTAAIVCLQEMVLACPTRRALVRSNRHAEAADEESA